MANVKSIFKSLSAGISFDKKRFKSEAEKFGLSGKVNGVHKPTEFMSMPELPDSSIQSPTSSDDDEEEPSTSEEELDFKLMGEQHGSGLKKLCSLIKILSCLGNMAVKRKRSAKASKSNAKKVRLKAVDLYKQNVNRFRNVHRIHVFGTDIPEPIDSWTKLASK